VHADESGLWHANVTVFGAWSAALGYTLDWLMRAPPECGVTRRVVEWGLPWFLLVELKLPANERRAVPLVLHVASVTGTTGSGEITRHLFECADLVIFQANPLRAMFDRALFAREDLEPWLRERALDALVVFQFDTGAEQSGEFMYPDGTRVHEDPPVRLSAEEMCAQLSVGEHPFVETNSWAQQRINLLFRAAVERLLQRRETLPPRPSYG
jgi:hypothetical protein